MAYVILDGLVPKDSALLIGSKQVVMKKTAHGKAFGKYCYGSKNKVEEWLNKSLIWYVNNLNKISSDFLKLNTWNTLM